MAYQYTKTTENHTKPINKDRRTSTTTTSAPPRIHMSALYKNKVMAPFNFLVQFLPSELALAIAAGFNARAADGAAVDVEHARAAMRAVLALDRGGVLAAMSPEKAMKWRAGLDVDEQRFSILLDFVTALAEVVFLEHSIGGHRQLYTLLLRTRCVEEAILVLWAFVAHSLRLPSTYNAFEVASGALNTAEYLGGGELASPENHRWRCKGYVAWRTDKLTSLYKRECQGGMNVIVLHAKNVLCWGCERVVFDMPRGVCGEFPRRKCKGCGFAVYCSAACHSRDKKLIHRELCPLLYRLREAFKAEYREHEEGDLDDHMRYNISFMSNAYLKWKRGDEHWRPFFGGSAPSLPIYEEIIAVLARDFAEIVS